MKKKNRKYFVEYPDVKRGYPSPMALREPTEADWEEGNRLYSSGVCTHSIIYDTPGFEYDLRHCAFCNSLLAFI